MKNGFGNWNNGYEAWIEWYDILYEPNAHYNVYGKKLTLQEYKDMMKMLFGHFTMEFVRFKDNGGDIGARVIEGWVLSDKPLA